MERGLYAAATGMMAQQTIQDTLAQNLANSNTVGYKQDIPTFRAVHGMALRRVTDGNGGGQSIGQVGLGVAPDKVYTDWQSGPIATTNGALDASLEPGHFFTVQTPRGTRYTRAGNFQIDNSGALTTANGLPILGTDNQPIKIAGSVPPKIAANGAIIVDGKAVAQVGIVHVANGSLIKDGDSLFQALAPLGIRPSTASVVHPGTLEQSNVSIVGGMVRLITVSRGFDMAQRAITTQDDMLKHAANDLARI